MTLSNKSIQRIADALTQEVIDYIQTDERYAEFLIEVIPDIISKKLGSHDDELMQELSMCIMDRIYMRCAAD